MHKVYTSKRWLGMGFLPSTGNSLPDWSFPLELVFEPLPGEIFAKLEGLLSQMMDDQKSTEMNM